ncbi:MAG: SDR family NAD(P)-dependent oxidoreductase [Acidimicrobiales bacterium]
MAGRLEGKVAIVVGGGTGFGLATVRRFAEEGATQVIAGRRLEVVEAVAAEYGGTAARCDVVDDDSIQELVATTLEHHGNLDIAISYAGYQESIPLRDLTPEVMTPMIDVQFNGAIYFLRHTANAMADHGGGSIINISSTTAHRPTVNHIAYASAKAGIEYATQVAALDYGPDQVRVNCIAPHLIETEMTKDIFAMKLPIAAILAQTPLGRMGSVDDIANCALFLASDESGYISGQTIIVDGANSTQKLPTAAEMEARARARPDLLE